MNSEFSYKNYQVEIYEKILDNLIEGIILSDKDGKILVYNEAMAMIDGRLVEDMLNKYLWDAYKYSDKKSSQHMQVVKSKKPLLNNYGTRLTDVGPERYKSYNTYPIIMDGEAVAAYSIVLSEEKLQRFLSQTIEQRRDYFMSQFEGYNEKYNSNGTIYNFSDIIGSSNTMKEVIRDAQRIAWVDNNVLIIGDTGTGKELFAQSIHNYGNRKDEPFVAINCSAIPKNLLESILFGTVKGAFTGAIDSDGLFKKAGNGTLFLDELNSMPISMQTKLLRVLQEKRVRPLGGDNIEEISCRIVTAINESPEKLIAEGKLRDDLYYRISGYSLYLPDLKDRENDILELSTYFIKLLNKKLNKNVLGISRELRQTITKYGWPGNIRELQHFIENMMIRVDDETFLTEEHVPEYMKKKFMQVNVDSYLKNDSSLPGILDSIEKDLILKALKNNNWNITKTSEDLGIIRQSLYYRMSKLGIEK